MCYNYTGSKFRLSMPYFSVGIIFSKHSITHQGRTQDFSNGVSKEGIAKAISTAHFVPACAWCAQAACSEKSVTLRGVSRNSGILLCPMGTNTITIVLLMTALCVHACMQ